LLRYKPHAQISKVSDSLPPLLFVLLLVLLWSAVL